MMSWHMSLHAPNESRYTQTALTSGMFVAFIVRGVPVIAHCWVVEINISVSSLCFVSSLFYLFFCDRLGKQCHPHHQLYLRLVPE